MIVRSLHSFVIVRMQSMTAPYRSPQRIVCTLFAISVLPLINAGCSGVGNVSGKITYGGKTLVWGTVQFEGSDGIIRPANIEPDGSYCVTGVPTGEVKVAVSSINPKSSDFVPMQREGGPPPPPRPEVKGWFEIPKKYDTTFNSGLSYTIKRGDNKIDIELK
jgi:hypothetical protein